MFPDLQDILAVQFFGIQFRIIALSLLIILAAILFKTVVTDMVFVWLKALTAKTPGKWDDVLIEELHKPTAALVLTLGIYSAVKVFPLPEGLDKTALLALKCVITVIVFWAIIRSLNAAALLFSEHGKAKGLSIATFVPLFKQILIIIVAMIGIITILDMLGFSVTSIIAALGIGGAALAFASQSTIANLYGSIAIALDRPFKVGDFVKVGTATGTVEAIGLRSTQIRTQDKTLISIPNNTIANEAIENHTIITNRRILTILGLTYNTTQAQIEKIIAELQSMLASMKSELMEEPQQVYFVALADSALNIELLCYAKSGDVVEMKRIRQKIFFEIMKIVERNESSFAYPTQTLHIVKES